ncbi:hypothetical protein [Streptomyces sp. CB03238]|uniref:hypothetical protein n=1 Tax=Streptomyces sp. CB03238 TaxID=1907777 RepID=UPI000A0F83D7|nr:hypothetical protein [Streptomyces sp. CB03238]ORT58511.1 hypothetical protein BKD26_18090 [Streptomyces sp. CB03238]
MSKKRTSVLPYARSAAMALVALLLVVAGTWASWGSAQHVLLSKGREHGTLTVTGCSADVCTGRYDPEGPAGPRTDMTIDRSVAVQKGGRYPVVVKPDTTELVRTGWPGGLHAWLPLGGALLLAALVIGGGMRLPRLAWVSASVGGALLVGTFFAL